MGVKPPQPSEIADRLAIEELISRYSRAMDRVDRPLALDCWWPEGTDSHAPLYAGSALGFIDFIWPVHQSWTLTRHVVTNLIVVLKGATAASECYWSAVMRIPRDGQSYDLTCGGRYVDQFEKRGDEWRFTHRESIRDWSRTDKSTTASSGSQLVALMPVNNPEIPETYTRRDRQDYSYGVLGTLGAAP